MLLPQPTAEAIAHSARVIRHIKREIEATGGWMSFARYMELALYAPGLGYYSAGAGKFGVTGDFVTAPEISALFGHALARPVGEAIRQTGGDILEIGAGSGKLALDLLRELGRMDALPARYLILELSADLRERQQMLFHDRAPEFASRVLWLNELPAKHRGVVFGNEVLDAMPVHLIHWDDGQVFERGVIARGNSFAWADRPISNEPLRIAVARMAPGDDYVSEVSLAIPAFVRTVGSTITDGCAIFIDYGFLRDEFYHPQRNRGTLMCHYRHRANDDPFYLPGLQDITAHVDFSAVIDAGGAAGLRVVEFCSQARFLIDCGITDLLAQKDPRDAAAYLPLANQVQRLLSPAEMGELFKVVVFRGGGEQL